MAYCNYFQYELGLVPNVKVRLDSFKRGSFRWILWTACPAHVDWILNSRQHYVSLQRSSFCSVLHYTDILKNCFSLKKYKTGKNNKVAHYKELQTVRQHFLGLRHATTQQTLKKSDFKNNRSNFHLILTYCSFLIEKLLMKW